MKRAATLILIAALAGCAAPAPSGERAGPSTLGPRVDAVRGRSLVLPVDPGALGPFGSAPAVRIDDGPPLPARLFDADVAPSPAEPGEWLARASVWTLEPTTITPLDAETDPAPSVNPPTLRLLRVEIPPGAQGQTLRVGSLWHPLALHDPVNTTPPAPALATTLPAPETFAPALASPDRRWRVGLLRRHAGAHDRTAMTTLGHPALDAVAAQVEQRWLVGLERLRRLDPSLAARTFAVLVRTGEVGGRRVPTWPIDLDALNRLQRDLLDTTLAPAQLRDRVNAWLASQPRAAVRLRNPRASDDGSLATAEVVETRARAGVARMTADGRSGPPLTVDALGSALLPVTLPASDEPVELAVRLGDWEESVGSAPPVIEAQPPGVRLGPLVLDLTLESWLAGGTQAADRSRAGAAMLQARAGGRQWEVYIECRRTSGDGVDTVRVLCGPADEPTAVVRVDERGRAVEEVSGREIERVAFRRDEDRWSALVELPAGAAGPDGTLLVGVRRRDASGAGSAWPAALAAWEDDPGRVAVDLTRWSGLERRRR